MKCSECGKDFSNFLVDKIILPEGLCLDCYQFDKSKYTIIDSSVTLVSVERLNGLEAENKALKEQVERLKCCENCKHGSRAYESFIDCLVGGRCRRCDDTPNLPDLWEEEE